MRQYNLLCAVCLIASGVMPRTMLPCSPRCHCIQLRLLVILLLELIPATNRPGRTVVERPAWFGPLSGLPFLFLQLLT